MRLRGILPVLGLALLAPWSGTVFAQAEDALEGALVGAEACLECHDAAELGTHDVHLRIEPFEVQGRTVGCEGCHGPGGLHAEAGDPELIRGLSADDGSVSDTCVACHGYKHFPEWRASTHAAEEVGCTSCHAIHQDSSPESTCIACHAESVARFRLPSHHPVREGKMGCSSCHDVHAATEGLLKSRMRQNDLCFTCHQAKEGPFIFEHPPVQEDCQLCHEPHGSVANNLLTANEPTLCLQCHDFHFHAGYQSSEMAEVDVGGIEHENPLGPRSFNIAFTTSCTQCHNHIHGSDLPSQTVTSGGRGLIP